MKYPDGELPTEQYLLSDFGNVHKLEVIVIIIQNMEILKLSSYIFIQTFQFPLNKWM